MKGIYRFFRGKGLRRIPLLKRFGKLYCNTFLPKGIVLVKVPYNLEMYVDMSDTIISKGLYLSGEKFKHPHSAFFKSLIKEGMTVVDIGANIGWYTIIAAKSVGKDGKVFAFEPDPRNYELLVKNIEINKFSNVIPVNKAVSNKAGTTTFFLSSDNRGASTFVNREGGGGNR